MRRTRPVVVAIAVFLLGLAGTDSAFAQKGRSYSSGGGRSAPSGSRSSPSPPRSSPSPPRSTPSVPRPSPPPRTSPPIGRNYAGSETKSDSGAKPLPGPGYDAAAGRSQRQQESMQTFQGAQPKPTYRDRSGQEQKLNPADPRVEDVRRRTTPRQWDTREQRRRDVYIPPMQPGPVIVYHDPYSNWFWWWMMAQSLDTRASWAYHHRSDMDEQRYRDLLKRDAELEAKVKELEAKQVKRDPTYAPPGVDSDLMYTDEYAEAAYNPQKREPVAVPATAPRSGWGLKVLAIVLGLLLFGFVGWLVFVKRWDVD